MSFSLLYYTPSAKNFFCRYLTSSEICIQKKAQIQIRITQTNGALGINQPLRAITVARICVKLVAQMTGRLGRNLSQRCLVCAT